MDDDFRAIFGFQAERVVGVEDFHDGTGSRRHHGFSVGFTATPSPTALLAKASSGTCSSATTSPVIGETSAAMVLR
jgi:hypothetical protein